MRDQRRVACFALLVCLCFAPAIARAEGGAYPLPALSMAVTWPAGWVRSAQAALDAMNLQRNANFRTAPVVSFEVAKRQGTAYYRLRIASETADAWDAAAYRDALMADFLDMMTQLGSPAILEPIDLTLCGLDFTGAMARADGYLWVYCIHQSLGTNHVLQFTYPEADTDALAEMIGFFSTLESLAGVEE